MLLTVQERLFALQIPKVAPSKIKSQYEVQAEQDAYVQSLKEQGIPMLPEGVDKKYLSIRDVQRQTFTRNLDKTEAGVKPEEGGTMQFKSENVEKVEPHPFDAVINAKVNANKTGMPKFSFETQELYGQAHHLC